MHCERCCLRAVLSKLRDQAVAMKKASTAPEAGAGGDERFKTAAATMIKYLSNIVANPDEVRAPRSAALGIHTRACMCTWTNGCEHAARPGHAARPARAGVAGAKCCQGV